METPIAFDELKREMHLKIYRFLMQLKFVIAPLPFLVGGFVILADGSPWRRIILGILLLSAVLLVTVQSVRARHGHQPNLEQTLLVVGLVFHPVILFATGGVLSPVLLAMLLVCFVASTVFPRKTSGTVLSVQIALIVAAAVFEQTKWLGSLVPSPFSSLAGWGPSPALLLIYTTVASLFFLVTRELGCRIQLVFAEFLQRTIAARDDALKLHREQLADLTQLTGEIAHELRNPLSSVKGLAALLARRNSCGDSESFAVLRREVDRMQEILEEFLNFSRPLVPLALARVNLNGLIEEVISMHEGTSVLHNVTVDFAPSATIEAYCDSRKVRQILVNLLQNAFDAFEQPGRIVIELGKSEALVALVIFDEGRGIDASVRGRVFEAGVTSKPTGSGLGLNVARGLARQHGGDVTLEARGARGCVATLTLPLRPPVGEESGVIAENQPNTSNHTLLGAT